MTTRLFDLKLVAPDGVVDRLGAGGDFLSQQNFFDEMHGFGDDGHFVEIGHFNGYLCQQLISSGGNRLAMLQHNRLGVQSDILLDRGLDNDAANARGFTRDHPGCRCRSDPGR